MNSQYTATAKSLHWLMALLLIGLLVLGFYMAGLPLSPDKLRLYSWHKWAGVTVFVLLGFRLLWRVTHRPPALPASMSAPMQLAAHAGHFVLYALMIAIPLSGWLMSSAKGIQTVYFGVLPIPDLIGKSEELGDLLKEVHEALNWGLFGLVGLHVAGALKHHIIDRDSTLRRMLPFGK